MDHHVSENPPRPADIVGRWCPRIARGDDPHFRRADPAIFNGCFQRHEMRIKPAVEPDHQRRTRFGNHLQTGPHARRVQINRLFTEDRLASTREQFDLVGMQVGWRAQNDPVNSGIGRNGIDIHHRSPIARGNRLRGVRHRIKNGSKVCLVTAGNCPGMHLANPPCPQNCQFFHCFAPFQSQIFSHQYSGIGMQHCSISIGISRSSGGRFCCQFLRPEINSWRARVLAVQRR